MSKAELGVRVLGAAAVLLFVGWAWATAAAVGDQLQRQAEWKACVRANVAADVDARCGQLLTGGAR